MSVSARKEREEWILKKRLDQPSNWLKLIIRFMWIINNFLWQMSMLRFQAPPEGELHFIFCCSMSHCRVSTVGSGSLQKLAFRGLSRDGFRSGPKLQSSPQSIFHTFSNPKPTVTFKHQTYLIWNLDAKSFQAGFKVVYWHDAVLVEARWEACLALGHLQKGDELIFSQSEYLSDFFKTHRSAL